MNFLDRNILPKFQERLDLASSDLNGMEDVVVEAINELAGRLYIINNLIPEEDRDKYASETNSLLITTIESLKQSVIDIKSTLTSMKEKYDSTLKTLTDNYIELDKRLNTLDDVAARKADLNVLYKRVSDAELAELHKDY